MPRHGPAAECGHRVCAQLRQCAYAYQPPADTSTRYCPHPDCRPPLLVAGGDQGMTDHTRVVHPTRTLTEET